MHDDGGETMQWGWNPDTVAAITTALAAIAAVVAGFFAWGAYKSEQEGRRLSRDAHDLAQKTHEASRQREQRASEDKKRKQAEMVSAWAVVCAGDDGESYVEVCVQNLSSAPVYSVSLGALLSRDTAVYAGWARVVPPSGRNPSIITVKDAAVEAWRRWASVRTPKPAPYVEFTFHDASGHWWLRDGRGVLSEIVEAEAYRYGK